MEERARLEDEQPPGGESCCEVAQLVDAADGLPRGTHFPDVFLNVEECSIHHVAV